KKLWFVGKSVKRLFEFCARAAQVAGLHQRQRVEGLPMRARISELAPHLGERVNMIVDAQIDETSERRVLNSACAHHDQCGGLSAADVAAFALGGFKRGHETIAESALRR